MLGLYQTPQHKGTFSQETAGNVLEAGKIEHPTSLRMALIKLIKSLAYPTPLIDNMLALPGKSSSFSTLELRSVYWQVAPYKANMEKSEFLCHVALYHFSIILFRLADASGILQVMFIVLVAPGMTVLLIIILIIPTGVS